MERQYALRSGAWKAAAYLLDCGAAQPDSDSIYSLGWLGQRSETNNSYVQPLLKHELNDAVQTNCLTSCWNDLDSFTNLVSRLWPCNEFYTAARERQRWHLAMDIVRTLETTWYSPSPAVFQHLCGSFSFALAGSSTNANVLSCITLGLGNIVWHEPDVASKWYSAIRETALRLGKSLVMPQQQLLGYGMDFPTFFQIFPTSTPFPHLLLGSLARVPGYNMGLKSRRHRMGHRLAKCERAVQMWLSILRDLGIDLLEYGRQEWQRLKGQENGYESEIWRDVLHEQSHLITDNGLFEVRLISFEYGSEPGDWKLWWSEPTDGLVGDFWKEMEPEPLCIPGSWDEDF